MAKNSDTDQVTEDAELEQLQADIDKLDADTPAAAVEAELPADEPAFDPSQIVYPIGVTVGIGVERTWVGEHEYVVDPETGHITGLA